VRIDDLKRLKDHRPFQPFRLRLTDGHEIEIRHPDAIAWDDGERRTVLAISKGEHYWLDVALVTALVGKVPVEPTSEQPNGG
jgi:hypothetical protein